MRLREQNKQRTRETIATVALELFAEHGYTATTLVEIAEAAGLAPSTLHTYFPTKDSLLFSVYDAVIQSARERLLETDGRLSGIEALLQWVAADLPAVLAHYGADLLVTNYKLIHANPELRQHERARDILLEDVFAAAFARDLNPPDPLRAQVLGTITHHAIMDVWDIWTRQYAGDNNSGLVELTEVTVDHVREMLEQSQKAVATLPKPTPIELPASRRPTRARGHGQG
jgi:AcrR family transcriptional regulator